MIPLNVYTARGHRIETGEIENALLVYDGVSDVYVATLKEGEDVSLVAYVVLSEAASVKDLRDWLNGRLPHYMVPAYFVSLPVFPTTPSGKVDVKALPAPDMSSGRSVSYAAAENELQASLIKIWEEVLEKSPVGIHDNFFEIGGHSLKAVKIVSYIFKVFGVKTELKSIFANPTVSQLAAVISASSVQRFENIPKAPEMELYPASHAQKRLWLTDQYENEKLSYIIPLSKTIEGDFEPQAFMKAFCQLVERHEILRTTFLLKDEVLYQKINPADACGFNFKYEDISGADDAAGLIRYYSNLEVTTPFDLARGPLLRAKLLKTGPSSHVFLMSIHHIICDGWSMSIMIDETFRMYEECLTGKQANLPVLNIQYKDYSLWHNGQLAGKEAALAKAYWHRKLSGEIPFCSLATGYPEDMSESTGGTTFKTRFSAEDTGNMEELSRKNGVSLFVTLLSVTKTLIYRYTYQNDILVGTPAAGREHIDLHNQIGFFVNTLVLRDTISGEDEFTTVLKKVHHTSLDAFENQLYPYDLLVDEVAAKKDGNKSLFDIMVMLQNNKVTEMGTSSMQITDNALEFNTSKFELLFNFFIDEGLLNLEIEYNTRLFSAESVEGIAQNCKHLVQSILSRPDELVENLDMMPAAEKAEFFL
jgi:acyl carrier protein